MTTRKELQEWLNRFPEETIIEFGIQDTPSNYQSYGVVNFISPKLTDSNAGESWEFLDFRTNQFVKEGSPHFGKCFLQIGEAN